MPKFLNILKNCRRCIKGGSNSSCYYCHRRNLLTKGSHNGIFPEQIIIARIFGEKRFVRLKKI